MAETINGEIFLTSNVSWLSAKIIYAYTQNPSLNSTSVKVSLYVKTTDGATHTGNYRGHVVTPSNAYQNGGENYQITTEWKCMASYGGECKHDDDGNGSCVIGGDVWDYDDYKNYYKNPLATIRKTLVFPQIDRASPISAISTYIGNKSRISIGRYSNNFTHMLSYSFKGEKETPMTGVIIEKTNATIIDWVIPNDLLNQIPNSKSGEITIICDTYWDSKYIGRKQTTITGTAQASVCKPVISTTIYDGNPKTIALTGNNAKIVRYHSTANVDIAATGQYSARITSIKIKNGANTSNSTYNDTSVNLMKPFVNPETPTFTIYTYDSRGFSTIVNVQADMIDYVKLTCYIGNERPTADGKYNFTVKGNYFNSSFGAQENTLSVKYRWKIAGETFSEWQNMEDITYTNNSYSVSALIEGLEYQNTYIFEAKAEDLLNSAESGETAIKSKPVFDWSGQDFAFNVPVSIMDKPLYAPYVLFEGNSSGTIALSDVAGNYDYMEIYFTDNNGAGCGFTKVYNPDKKVVHLSLIEANSSVSFHIRYSNYRIDDAMIGLITDKYGIVYFNGTSWGNLAKANYLRITKVVGYK